MTETTQYPPFKLVYLYDAATGEYTGDYNAQLSPLEEGVYITPVHHTDVSPIQPVPPDQVNVFANGSWSLHPDYRGQTLYKQSDNTTITVDALGPIPSGYALTPPPPTLTEQVATLEADVQMHIDSKAQTKGYDSAASCISYLSSGNKTWAADALAMRDWRDAVWTFCYDSAGKVSVGTVPVPTKEQLIAALPAAPW